MNNLEQLKQAFAEKGCEKLYVKVLSANDNSKNQVYLAGSFDVLNVFPIREILTEEAGDWSRERFKASLDFSWLNEEGELIPAPHAQLILYPKYPEVRFSGFLKGCKEAPSALMTQRLQGRLLFLGVTESRRVIGYVSDVVGSIANEYHQTPIQSSLGVFSVIDLPASQNSKQRLLDEMRRINHLGWIASKRLDRLGQVLPCNSSNCGGYTLEAELGITPNGYSEPDYLGWEIKQFGVRKFDKIEGAVITLMTPEPTAGIYKSQGVDTFLRTYGYPDKRGREDRINFGGVHRVGESQSTTQLTMQLIGFDADSGKIRNASGKVALIDPQGNEAASWDFASMLKHWNRKHHQACYVPSMSQKAEGLQYRYGDKIILGERTDFQFFLQLMNKGHIYYDPGIKMEQASTTTPQIKRRSQFRVKSGFLPHLYHNNEVVEL